MLKLWVKLKYIRVHKMRPQYTEAMLFRDVATVRPYRNSRGLITNSLRKTRLWQIGQLIILTPRVLSDIFGSVPYAASNELL